MVLENRKIRDQIFTMRTAGDPNNPCVILLHGFPESSAMWVPLIETLSKKYYVMAPNQRGYSKGARPKKKSNYHIDFLIQDVLDLADSAGAERFHLVGHDWGSLIGWMTVDRHADRIISWTSLSVPHIRGFMWAYIKDPEQQKMSSYIKRFQIPFLPEFQIKRNDFKAFRRLWRKHPEEQVREYLDIFRQKGAVTAGLNYYRANLKMLRDAKELSDVAIPTLFIWGKNDIALGKAGVEKGHEFIKGPYTFCDLDAGHWLMQEAYDEVEQAIVKHLDTYAGNISDS